MKIKKAVGVVLLVGAVFLCVDGFVIFDNVALGAPSDTVNLQKAEKTAAEKAAADAKIKPISLPRLEVTYQNPLKVNSFTELIKGFLTQVQAIVGWLAVIMIVIGGLVYMTAFGKSRQIELGKTILTYALLGFTLAVAAPSILKEIFDLASSGKGTTNNDVIKNAKDIKDIIGSVMTFIIALVGIVSAIAFVITGFQFIVAGGDSSKADKARKGLTYAIIGVTVSGAALIVVKEVLKLMGIGV